MRERIRARLKEYRAEALRSIGDAVNKTKSEFSGKGRSNSHGYYRSINERNEAGFAKYMDRSAAFIRHLAPGSSAEFVDELWDAGHKLKQEIVAKSDQNQLKAQLGEAIDKLIERKVEDFELGYMEGKDMAATTNNTVTIIGSQISNSVLEINQSGRDTISKETANKLEQVVKSEEINALPEAARLEVLDQVTDLIRELKGPTDAGKVHRGLKKLAEFVKSVASSSVAEMVAQATIAWATAKGLA